MYQETRAATVVAKPTYITRNGRYLLQSQKRIFRDLLTETVLDWETVPDRPNVWVVSKMTSTTGSTANARIPKVEIALEFSDWQVNTDIPEGVFGE